MIGRKAREGGRKDMHRREGGTEKRRQRKEVGEGEKKKEEEMRWRERTM